MSELSSFKSKEKTLVCIKCPIGCDITGRFNSNEVTCIEGALCQRGKEFFVKEVTDPKRILIHHIKVNNGEIPLVSVRSDHEVPQKYIFDLINILNEKEVEAPVYIGDTMLYNPFRLGINIIATKTVEKLK